MAGVYLGNSEILAILNELDSIGNHSRLPLALSNLRSKLACSLDGELWDCDHVSANPCFKSKDFGN